jgi:hypothetical protein
VAGRIRTIKPELLENARTGRLDDEAWRLYVSMLLLADDYGNLYGDHDRIAGAVFWHGPRRDIRETLARLSRAGLVMPYEVAGQPYVTILGWSEHQRVDKPGKARVPSPDRDLMPIRETLAKVPETLAPDLRSGSPTTTSLFPAAAPLDLVSSKFDFEVIYALYPRKLGRKKGLQRCRSVVTTQAKYDSLLVAVKHYAAFVAGTEDRFIKHFDSFMSCWEDWVEPKSPPGSAGRANGTPAKPNRPPLLDGPPRYHGESDEDYGARCKRLGGAG